MIEHLKSSQSQKRLSQYAQITQEIGQYEEGICLVTIIGERKSGKSTLLNQIMGLDRQVQVGLYVSSRHRLSVLLDQADCQRG